MAKGDQTPGLLSKVARFVRNPTRSWTELDEQEPEPDKGYSKEALKEMIERKRQNDFVRKREFDYLRKLRRREPRRASDALGRTSFFQSSLPSNFDERAETLKKIDEIEAQMSRQWWKGKPDDPAPHTSAFRSSRPAPSVSPETTASVTFNKTGSDNEVPGPGSVAHLDIRLDARAPAEFEPTQMSPSAALHAAAQQNVFMPPPVKAGAGTALMGAGFGSERLFAVEPADTLTDPDLEEAAIRFANGDDAGAEAGLLHALQGDHLRPELVQAWTTALFDLYRMTGQKSRFDGVALDFAKRFGRSAPAWASIPDSLANESSVSAVATDVWRDIGDQALWHCPAELTATSLRELGILLQDQPFPWHLDWRALVAIASNAVEPFDQLLRTWSESPVQLVFCGHDKLDQALRALTPANDKHVNPRLWQLRMDALRVMGLHDEFERVAIEYCLLFEVSPPSWHETRCVCQLDGKGLASDRAATGEPDGRGSTNRVNAATTSPAVQAELVGEIRGDATDILKRLGTGLEGSTRLVISCARLIRVDFTAAGSILTWVSAQQERGCQVQFRDVSSIVAAFFNVIGISEQAQVVPRNT